MTHPIRHSGKAALLALTLTLLAGCSAQSLLGEPPPPQIYVLRPRLGASPAAPRVNWSLDVAMPDAPMSLSDTHIAIQRSSETLDFYANAAWQDRMPALLQRALIEGFEASGKIAAVANDSQGLNATYLLQTDLRRFEADYTTPDGAPTIEVEIGARLMKIASRTIVATTVVRERVPASANSVPAAVAAFDTATGKAVEALVGWTLSAPGDQANDRASSAPAHAR